MTTLQENIDLIPNHGIYKSNYLIERYLVDKSIQELREEVERLYWNFSEVSRMNPEFNLFYKEICALIGEKK